MKKLLSLALMAMMSAAMMAENIQTIVLSPTPKLVCEKCEKKVKTNLRYVKGTKSIETSVKDNTITITYDADKAQPQAYLDELKKIGRKAEVSTPATKEAKASK